MAKQEFPPSAHNEPGGKAWPVRACLTVGPHWPISFQLSPNYKYAGHVGFGTSKANLSATFQVWRRMRTRRKVEVYCAFEGRGISFSD
jgi:hypothetical protein